MASLTETAHRMKGSTVLYVPIENIENIKEARKQKDLVQRLECLFLASHSNFEQRHYYIGRHK